MRIVNEEQINKELMGINVANMSLSLETKIWKATFLNTNRLLLDTSKKLLEIYLRERPELIKYEQPFNEKIKIEQLLLGTRVVLESFPLSKMIKEQEQEINHEKKQLQEEERRKAEIKRLEKEEYDRRKKAGDKGGGDEGQLKKIKEEDEDMDDHKSEKSDKKSSSKAKIEKNDNDQSIDLEEDLDDERGKKKNYEQQLEELERNIDQLKKENEEYQRRIAYIYEVTKNEKDSAPYYKDTNINESTYTDSLNSAANLYNELHTHRKKLEADEKRYESSIKVQEDRKRDVYEILMKYKEELLSNAESSRKGTKISDFQIREWMSKEKEFEEKVISK